MSDTEFLYRTATKALNTQIEITQALQAELKKERAENKFHSDSVGELREKLAIKDDVISAGEMLSDNLMTENATLRKFILQNTTIEQRRDLKLLKPQQPI